MFVIPLSHHSGDLKPNDFTERETDQHYGGQSLIKKVKSQDIRLQHA